MKAIYISTMTKSRCLSTRWGITSFRCLHAEELTNIPEEEMIKVKNQQQMVLEKYFKKGKSLDEKDLHCIETRQRFKATPDLFAVDKELCQYGFPRVYVRYPFSESFQTGYMRLSCPHLIKAVDHLEAKGGLQRFDKLLQSDSPRGEEYRENFLKVNDTWNKIFNDLMTDFMRDLGLKFLEKFKTSESFKYFLDTGFIGISKRDVDQAKCLHAHLADHLIRGDNKIGELVEKELMHNGVSTKGCNDCWQQCDSSFKRTKTSWWYQSNKGRAGIVKRKLAKKNAADVSSEDNSDMQRMIPEQAK